MERSGFERLKGEVTAVQGIFKDVQEQMLQLVAENQRLTRQLKTSVSAHIRDVALEKAGTAVGGRFGVERRTVELERQLHEIREEKDSVVSLWQQAQKDVERLEGELENARSHPEVQVLHSLVDKVGVSELQREHRNVVSKLVARLSIEAEETSQWKERFRTSEMQSQNLTRALELSRQRLAEKQEELERSNRREQQSQEKAEELVATIAQLHLRLETANLEAAEMEDSTLTLQNGMSLLHNQLRPLKAERLAAVHRAKENVQLAEEALQERDAAVVREKQALREVERLQSALSRLVDEAGIKTGCEVENVKLSCNSMIEELLNEIKTLELTNNQSRSQLERQSRDKRTLMARLDRTTEECELRVASAATLRDADLLELERVSRERDAAMAQLESTRQEMVEDENRCRVQDDEHQRSRELAAARICDLASRVESMTEEKLELALKVEDLQRQLLDDRDIHERRMREAQIELSSYREDWELQKEGLEAKFSVQEELRATAIANLHHKMNGQLQALTRQQTQLTQTNKNLRIKIDRLEAELRDRRSTRSGAVSWRLSDTTQVGDSGDA